MGCSIGGSVWMLNGDNYNYLWLLIVCHAYILYIFQIFSFVIDGQFRFLVGVRKQSKEL